MYSILCLDTVTFQHLRRVFDRGGVESGQLDEDSGEENTVADEIISNAAILPSTDVQNQAAAALISTAVATTSSPRSTWNSVGVVSESSARFGGDNTTGAATKRKSFCAESREMQRKKDSCYTFNGYFFRH